MRLRFLPRADSTQKADTPVQTASLNAISQYQPLLGEASLRPWALCQTSNVPFCLLLAGSIPPTLGGLKALTYLALNSNHLTGEWDGGAPPELFGVLVTPSK